MLQGVPSCISLSFQISGVITVLLRILVAQSWNIIKVICFTAFVLMIM